jgi:hypothetical protein
MYEAFLFFVAGGALGGASAYLHGRKPSTLGLLVGLYAIALAVCFIIGHATKIEILAFIAPYVLVLIGASLWGAGLTIYGARVITFLMGRARATLTVPASA